MKEHFAYDKLRFDWIAFLIFLYDKLAIFFAYLFQNEPGGEEILFFFSFFSFFLRVYQKLSDEASIWIIICGQNRENSEQ